MHPSGFLVVCGEGRECQWCWLAFSTERVFMHVRETSLGIASKILPVYLVEEGRGFARQNFVLMEFYKIFLRFAPALIQNLRCKNVLELYNNIDPRETTARERSTECLIEEPAGSWELMNRERSSTSYSSDAHRNVQLRMECLREYCDERLSYGFNYTAVERGPEMRQYTATRESMQGERPGIVTSERLWRFGTMFPEKSRLGKMVDSSNESESEERCLMRGRRRELCPNQGAARDDVITIDHKYIV
ncbi:hypothetical protein DFH09DRAFT_1101752 [Mycena vulgaris]|nr:hypothetical protein DFH09DRAFT_1103834 [Mycena vulgaris]KAJ6504956.1 hypothetical protein DFH09DRAFT_1101752 [Mycena vulgaris]